MHWRAPHHGYPDPEFANLCADAEALGLHVSLDASPTLLGREPHEYRLLGPLIIGIPERPQMMVVPFGPKGFDRTLHQASVLAREKLAAMAGGAPDA